MGCNDDVMDSYDNIMARSRPPADQGNAPRWRVGRKVGRTLYHDDVLVGVMDTPELAAETVAALNAEQAVKRWKTACHLCGNQQGRHGHLCVGGHVKPAPCSECGR